MPTSESQTSLSRAMAPRTGDGGCVQIVIPVEFTSQRDEFRNTRNRGPIRRLEEYLRREATPVVDNRGRFCRSN